MPTAASAATAASGVMPTTLGTVTGARPSEHSSVITVPTGSVAPSPTTFPARSTARMTVPAATVSL